MANKKSNKKEFPRDHDQLFSFNDTILKNFKASKYPVSEETIFKDKSFGSNGLRIRAYPSGKAVYFVEKRIRSAKGGAKKRIICNVGEITVAKARTNAGKFISWMAEGIDPYIELKKEKEVNKIYTVKDAYELYMIDRKIGASTIERYERQRDIISFVHINKKESWKDIKNISKVINTNIYKGKTSHLKSLLDADLNEISSQSILKIHTNITESHGHGDKDAHTEGDRVIKFIGHLYDLAIAVFNEKHDNNSFIKRNPTKIMSHGINHWNNTGGRARRKQEALDTNHIKAHYDAITALKTLKNKSTDQCRNIKYTKRPIPGAIRAHYFLRFLFWTGWRPGDVALIQWDQIEKEDGITTVSWDDEQAFERLKTFKPIYKVSLNHQAVKVLDELRENKNIKMQAIKDGDLTLPKNYDDKHVFLNVDENNHIKSNQHSYEAIVSKISDLRHYPTGIYRKTFLTYGGALKINIYTLKRLVFHTQNYFDVTSAYMHTSREVLKEASEDICSHILSIIDPVKYNYEKKSDNQEGIKIDQNIYKEIKAQFKDKADNKFSDLLRISIALKLLNPKLFNLLDSTTTENAEFEDQDFDD
jgi:integrase